MRNCNFPPIIIKTIIPALDAIESFFRSSVYPLLARIKVFRRTKLYTKLLNFSQNTVGFTVGVTVGVKENSAIFCRILIKQSWQR